ncbi:MAG: hypothetical protein HJJLKODD_02416 [Phycisphaerae bacterium]|nr:hypothetical protein [Phycisphaerae bacterium]
MERTPQQLAIGKRLIYLVLFCTAGLGALASSRSMTAPTAEPLHRAAAKFVPPLATCFAPGTDPNYMAEMEAKLFELWANSDAAQNDLGRDAQYWLGSRWSGSQGSPRTITWSFVPDGLSIGSGIGESTAPSELFSRMDSLFASQGGRATWINRVQQCFNRWSELTGITFTRITTGGNDWDDGASWGSGGSSTRGEMRISMKPIDGSSNVLAYCFFPSSGDMVLDRAESWGSSSNAHRFLRNTITHEMGHGIGIQHVCSNNNSFLMEPILSTSFDGPRHDDIRAGQRHYGDSFESDNTASTATFIGNASDAAITSTCTLPTPISGSNPTSSSNCTIDANGEVDYFEFDVAGPSRVSITVTPQGLTYDDNQQSGSGSCPSGSSTNSLTRANLAVQLIGSNGTTVLATASAAASGLAETISNILVPTGNYYVRVYETDSPTQSQMYTFSVTADDVECYYSSDCDDNQFCNGSESCLADGSCLAGSDPCPGELCREVDDQCVQCLSDSDCLDTEFCNGSEVCLASGDCSGGTDPCPDELCRETDDQCVQCLEAADCDDGLFCNGVESCSGAGDCADGADPCGTLICDEVHDRCKIRVYPVYAEWVQGPIDAIQIWPWPGPGPGIHP